MSEALIENGCAKVQAGEWLMGRSQPVACTGPYQKLGLRGFIVQDRSHLVEVRSQHDLYCASADKPFLCRLDALPDEKLNVISSKLLVAPKESRVGARCVKIIPMCFKRAMPVTEFQKGWVIASTRGRAMRVAVKENETLMVNPESVIAWIGKDPTGFCPKLGIMDILLPRGPRELAFSFHGPCTIWFEGTDSIGVMRTARKWR